jgi:hypothetical protein
LLQTHDFVGGITQAVAHHVNKAQLHLVRGYATDVALGKPVKPPVQAMNMS